MSKNIDEEMAKFLHFKLDTFQEFKNGLSYIKLSRQDRARVNNIVVKDLATNVDAFIDKIKLNEKVLKLDNLSQEVTIAHLSDVHFGSVRHKQIIRQISDKLNQLEGCDLAIISGDLADGSSIVEVDDFMEFKNVKMPIIFTPGNHDFYPGIDNVIAACKHAGIIILDNERRKILWKKK